MLKDLNIRCSIISITTIITERQYLLCDIRGNAEGFIVLNYYHAGFRGSFSKAAGPGAEGYD